VPALSGGDDMALTASDAAHHHRRSKSRRSLATVGGTRAARATVMMKNPAADHLTETLTTAQLSSIQGGWMHDPSPGALDKLKQLEKTLTAPIGPVSWSSGIKR
jgi:hypothetical protein